MAKLKKTVRPSTAKPASKPASKPAKLSRKSVVKPAVAVETAPITDAV